MTKKGNGDNLQCPTSIQNSSFNPQKKHVFLKNSLLRIVLSLSLLLSCLALSLTCYADAYASKGNGTLLQDSGFYPSCEPDRITFTFDDYSTAVLPIGHDALANGYSYSTVSFPDSYPNMTINKIQQFTADIDPDLALDGYEATSGRLENYFNTSKNIISVQFYWDDFYCKGGGSDDQYHLPQMPISGMTQREVDKLRNEYTLAGSLHYYNAVTGNVQSKDFAILGSKDNVTGAELPLNFSGDAVYVANLKYISSAGYGNSYAPIWFSDLRVTVFFDSSSNAPTSPDSFYGTWRFNDDLTAWTDPSSLTGGFFGDPTLGTKFNYIPFISADANAPANTRTYNGMYATYSQTWHTYYLNYLDGTTTSDGLWAYNTDAGWRNSALKEFTVIDSVKIEPDLYNFITTNATYIPSNDSSFRYDVYYGDGSDSMTSLNSWVNLSAPSSTNTSLPSASGNTFVSWLGTAVGGIFNVPIFGTFTLGEAFGAIVALLIVLALLRFFAT